jgi:hypothetical protein
MKMAQTKTGREEKNLFPPRFFGLVFYGLMMLPAIPVFTNVLRGTMPL